MVGNVGIPKAIYMSYGIDNIPYTFSSSHNTYWRILCYDACLVFP